MKIKLIAALMLMASISTMSYAQRIETQSISFQGPITTSNQNITGITSLSKVAYEDMLGPARIIVIGGANITWDDTLSGAQFDTGCTTNTTSDHLTFTYQIPHRKKVNTHIDPHMHWYQTNADQTSMWYIRYAWISIGATNEVETYSNTAAVNTQTYTVGKTVHQLSTFPEIVGTDKGISSLLRIKLYRKSGGGTGNITVTDLDCHYEVDGFGSDEELSKSY